MITELLFCIPALALFNSGSSGMLGEYGHAQGQILNADFEVWNKLLKEAERE